MSLNKITAIIRENLLDDVEKKLRNAGVRGISISKVRGYGEYADYFTPDMKTSHAKIEIFTSATKVDAIITTIMDIANTGFEGDGIIAVQSVEKIFRIRTRSQISSDNSDI